MKDLLNHISQLVPTLEGWTEVAKAQRLAAMVLTLQPDVSVEIGVYAGRSFFGLALAHKFLGHGMAVGIDPWDNAAATEGYEGANLEFWKTNPLNKIYGDFMRNIDLLGLQNVTNIIRAKSDHVTPPPNIGLLHIDSQHTEQAVTEVRRFAPSVRVGGLVIMDDASWVNGTDAPVQRAIVELKLMGFEELYPLGTGAVFQRCL